MVTMQAMRRAAMIRLMVGATVAWMAGFVGAYLYGTPLNIMHCAILGNTASLLWVGVWLVLEMHRSRMS